MDITFSPENHLNLLSSVIKSSNEIIRLIKNNTEISEIVYQTITQIFNFLNKIFKLLPEPLISDTEYKELKNNMIMSYQEVIAGWKNFNEKPLEFVHQWDAFIQNWDLYSAKLSTIKKNIYISMN